MNATDRIGELRDFISDNLAAVIDEARDQINEAITACVEDAQEQDKEAILSLSLGVKWNLDGNTVVLSLPVSVRRRFEAVGKLEDHAQPALPHMEEQQ